MNFKYKIGVRVTEYQYSCLEILAKEENTTISDQIREGIEILIKRYKSRKIL
jgi:hypothetical protein